MSLVLSMNKSNTAVSQFMDFEFLSAVDSEMGVLVASSGGLFLVGGGDDDGANIDAYFALNLSDIGSGQKKRVRSLLLAYEATKPVSVETQFDEDPDMAVTKSLPQTSGRQHRGKVNGERSSYGGSLQVTVANTDGGEFNVDSVSAFFVSGSTSR